MKILVTGGTGFLGSHLVKRLTAASNDVTVLARPNSSLNRLNDVLPDISVARIAGPEDLDNLFRHNGFEVVIHCATNYGKSETPLSKVFQDNVAWPASLLETAIRYNCRLFINTDSFFSKDEFRLYEYLRPYILSKRFFRETLISYSSWISVANLRLEHIYGTEEGPGKFTYFIFKQLLENSPVIELSDGWQKRDFIYVDDVVDAYLAVLLKSSGQQGFAEYSIGTGESLSIRTFVETIQHQLPSNKSKLAWGKIPLRANEIMDSVADTQAIKALGWKPATELTKGIQNIIAYFIRNGF